MGGTAGSCTTDTPTCSVLLRTRIWTLKPTRLIHAHISTYALADSHKCSACEPQARCRNQCRGGGGGAQCPQ